MLDVTHSIHRFGVSRSFPSDHPFIARATDGGEVIVLIGECPPTTEWLNKPKALAVVVELGGNLLEFYSTDGCPANLVGFSRWRLGDAPPTDLVELVASPTSTDSAVGAARAVFEASGLAVSECQDRAGRIVDRLIRPQFNLALNAVDNELATADDLETALRLGLGYRQGLLNMVIDAGLSDHHDVTRALFDAFGEAKYVPPRRASIAAQQRAIAVGP